MIRILSAENPLSHYYWGQNCEGWNFVDSDAISVKEELMPPGTAEEKHFHERSEQFFYILKGTALFQIEDESVELQPGQGIHVPPTKQHCIRNVSLEDLVFLLCSRPSTKGDRINCT